MGDVDIVKQAPNVSRMKLLGARVIPVSHGLKTLKEAVDGAFEGYMKEYETAIYCIGSVVGPHPFPLMVRDFQMVVGIEAREQFMEMTGNLPDAVVACVGGGSNPAGILTPFLADPVDLYGVEPMSMLFYVILDALNMALSVTMKRLTLSSSSHAWKVSFLLSRALMPWLMP
jgi:tryptophan synthase beta chain